jgi:hypothetical protein
LVVVLLLFVATSSVVAVWLTRRRREVEIWQRELDAAFASGERRELPRARQL